MGMTVKIRANPRLVHGGPESGVAELAFTGSATALSTRLSPGSAGFVVTGSAYAERTGDSATVGKGTLTVTGSATTTVVHQVVAAEGAATVAFAIAGFTQADAARGAAAMSFTGAAAVNVTRTQAGAATLAVTAAGHICSEGEYLSFITGLASGTTYYVRAYATNEIGTSYGAEVDFAAAGSTRTAGGAAGFAITAQMGESSPLYDVMDYGAHADGTTTDVDHIQAAITAASATGGTVYLPTGTYYLATTLTVPSGTKLLGDGVALTWLKGTVTYDGSSTLTGICTGAGGLFNVMDYGATHTGTHNDEPAISAAIAAAKAAGGGVVYLPAGTYHLDYTGDNPEIGPAALTGGPNAGLSGKYHALVRMDSGIILLGEVDGNGDPASTLYNDAPSYCSCIGTNQPNGESIGSWEVKNVRVTGNANHTQDGDGFKFFYGTNFKITNVYVENHYVAVALYTPASAVLDGVTVKATGVSNTGGICVDPLDTYIECKDMLLKDCHVTNNETYGFIASDILQPNSDPGFRLTNIRFENCSSTSGWLVQWNTSATLINCTCVGGYCIRNSTNVYLPHVGSAGPPSGSGSNVTYNNVDSANLYYYERGSTFRGTL